MDTIPAATTIASGQPRKHDNRNPYHPGVTLSVPWGLPRQPDGDLPRTVMATSINHQPMTRPYNVVMQVLATDERGMPTKWVVRSAYWELRPNPDSSTDLAMVPDGYGDGHYYWHGRPVPSPQDKLAFAEYVAHWHDAMDLFHDEAKEAYGYELKLMAWGRIDPKTGERLED